MVDDGRERMGNVSDFVRKGGKYCYLYNGSESLDRRAGRQRSVKGGNAYRICWLRHETSKIIRSELSPQNFEILGN